MSGPTAAAEVAREFARLNAEFARLNAALAAEKERVAGLEIRLAHALEAERRSVRVVMTVNGVRDFIALHRKATGRKDASISKVLALLDEALTRQPDAETANAAPVEPLVPARDGLSAGALPDREPCDTSAHGWDPHTRGGMCDGDGTPCYCIRINDAAAQGVAP